MIEQTEARKLAQQFGVRMCDENGDTHGEELYCLGLDDIIALREALAEQPAQHRHISYVCPQCYWSLEEQPAQQHDQTEISFDAWWKAHGQFLRAGGGDYEKTFAWHAWLASLACTEQPAQQQEPVGAVTVSHYKGLENHDFDYWGSLPDGTHNLYTSPQPAQQPCEAPCGDIKCAVMCKRHEQPAQQQEPVLCINPKVIDPAAGKVRNGTGALTYSDEPCAGWSMPLYEHSPASKPLTDEEIDEAQDAAEESFHAMNKCLKPRPLSERASYFDWHLARAIEAKLREKNAKPSKPLTDEQRQYVVQMWRVGNWTAGDIIDAVEAAHGIKEDA